MKVRYQTANARLTFEFESENDRTLVTNLAHIQEIFEESSCGCCKKENIRFDVREFDGNHYYKLLCDDCGATLDFGQHKAGNTLFVKRFEKDTREPLPNRGWYLYGKSPEKTPPAPPTSPPTKQAAHSAKPTVPPAARPAPSTNHVIQKPTSTPAVLTRAQQIAADVAKAIDGMDHSQSRDNLDDWKRWGQKISGLNPEKRDELQDAYYRNSDRLAGTTSPARRTG
jgi:hypothetical protein